MYKQKQFVYCRKILAATVQDEWKRNDRELKERNETILDSKVSYRVEKVINLPGNDIRQTTPIQQSNKWTKLVNIIYAFGEDIRPWELDKDKDIIT